MHGYTASKKVGNAVVRSRAKRRLRALFAEVCESLNDGTYILVAKEALASTSYHQLQLDFKKILKHAGSINNVSKSTS